jgi:hypothetical protein
MGKEKGIPLLNLISRNETDFGKANSLKPALDAGFHFGICIETIEQVFHRILDLKHGLGFYLGFIF